MPGYVAVVLSLVVRELINTHFAVHADSCSGWYKLDGVVDQGLKAPWVMQSLTDVVCHLEQYKLGVRHSHCNISNVNVVLKHCLLYNYVRSSSIHL